MEEALTRSKGESEGFEKALKDAIGRIKSRKK